MVTFGHMAGRHTGDFVVWTEDGGIERVFVPTGQAFTVRHAHFQRIARRPGHRALGRP